ncbi:MAG: hypothetical protein WCI02_05835 [Planctomycetota bacterium]
MISLRFCIPISNAIGVMIPKLSRLDRRAVYLCLAVCFILCPGIRPVVHSHTEYGRSCIGQVQLEHHLVQFHQDLANEPSEDHLHWSLNFLPGICTSTTLHRGLDAMECLAEWEWVLPSHSHILAREASFSSDFFSFDIAFRFPKRDRGDRFSPLTYSSAHSLYGIARI